MPLQHEQHSPFPMKVKARVGGHEETVLDEKCTCGHLRSEHYDTFSYGHGPCAMAVSRDGSRHCDCRQFTWTGQVFAS